MGCGQDKYCRLHSSYIYWPIDVNDSFGLPGSTPSSIFDVKENDDASNSPDGLFNPSRYFCYSYISQSGMYIKRRVGDILKFF